MRKIAYLTLAVIAVGVFSACSEFLEETPRTQVTANLLFTDPEGLQSEVVTIYTLDRAMMVGEEENTPIMIHDLDKGVDIDLFRGGTSAFLGTYSNFLSTNALVRNYWTRFYEIIGRANEVVASAEAMDQGDPRVAQASAEARFFRAQCYFHLFRRFEKIYINTEPTTVENMNGRVYEPAPDSSVYKLLYSDLDSAIKYLDWTIPTTKSGRISRGAAKHLKAKVALWKKDYDEAIRQVDEIDAQGIYSLCSSPKDVFDNGSGNLNHSEAIQVVQFSREVGGGTGSTQDNGHRLQLIYTPSYKDISGMVKTLEDGGYGWGRAYVNTYLMGLYDKSKDKRYTEYIRHYWFYNDPDKLPVGKQLGDTIQTPRDATMTQAHPACWKYIDKWTHNADETTSWKDIIISRLAETYIIGAEAYLYRDGGDHAKTKYYYNKTWMRAGNDEETRTITMEMIADEHARELFMEGHRWYFLKSLGTTQMIDRIKAHNGNTKAENSRLTTDQYAAARTNFDEHFTRWPIPDAQRQLMGTTYPQNPGY